MIKGKSLYKILYLWIAACILMSASLVEAESADFYKSISFDGIWIENFTNNAIYHKGQHQRVYSGWLDTYGNVVIGFYDLDLKKSQHHILIRGKKIIAENCAFSLTMSPDGKLMVFLADVNMPGILTTFTMSQAEKIDQWEQNQYDFLPGNDSHVTKIYAISANEPNEGLYVFAQQTTKDIVMMTSFDQGKSWSSKRLEFKNSEGSLQKWQNFYAESNHKNCIVLALQPEQGSSECENIYFASLENGVLMNLTGDELAGRTNPYPLQSLTMLSQNHGKFYDLAINENNEAIVVSISGGDRNKQVINYNRWDKNKWKSTDISISGKLNDATIDRSNTDNVFLTSSTDSIYEVSQATLHSNGRKFDVKNITSNSTGNNSLPRPVLNAPDDGMLCWLYQPIHDEKINPLAAIKISIKIPPITNVFDHEQIKTIISNVADWQLSSPYTRHNKTDWQWGAFYTGLIAAYEVTGDQRYLDEMMNVGMYYEWGINPDVLHADRLLVSDIYSYLYSKYEDPEMLVKTKWAFDLHLARKSKPELSHKPEASYKNEWWSWCDALYMAPPSFYHFANITGEEKYRQYAYDHWKLSTEFLYSEKDSLFYRDDRYFNAISENGFSVFWSRGNGWVIGGLARILTYLPANHPQREYYTRLYKEMAAKILNLQQPDGLWTVSLLDPEYLPKGEASGSGFFGYALAWGINNGILEPAIYEPAVRRAWESLSSYVNDAGRLGNVQQIAGDPFPFYEHQWHVYASGAYMLFGREMLELVNTTK